jgi:NADPH:quinone reductase-like Zn-dependent oxidoreductase
MIKAFGAPEGLSVTDLPDPEPAAGQVLIAVEAAGVGGVDTVIRRGTLGSYGFTEGFIPGAEVAGQVAAVGPGTDPSWTGRRVWAFTGTGGGYATHVALPATALVALPDGLSAADAVTLGTSGRTAHFGLRHAHFAAGESVLVRGGAGGIGVMAVQLAVRGGAVAVAVTASSPERGRRLRELGATQVLDRSGEAPAGEAGDAAPGYDVIFDIVAGPRLGDFFTRLNDSGRLVTVGAVAGWPSPDFASAMIGQFQRSLSFATFSTNTVPEAEQQAAVAELFAVGARGELASVVHEVLPLEAAVLAHQKMDAGEVFGRIVLVP